ncbi:MAG: hypothetical protein ACTSX9_08370 [Candidatus Njordarchaeales archaeon]
MNRELKQIIALIIGWLTLLIASIVVYLWTPFRLVLIGGFICIGIAFILAYLGIRDAL